MGKIKYTSVFFTAVLVIAAVGGIVPSVWGTNGGSDLFEEIEPLVDVYNKNVENIPVIKSFIGEERIHANISLNNGSALILAITTDKDAKVVSFTKAEISDPTIRAYTDENTVRTIINSGDPVSAFQDALNTGAITYEGVGLGNKIKVGVMKAALKIAGFFM
ncbi:MAG: hypothetical protein JJE19_00505 [Methanosarcinales archaeon]|nr:hypothetical protein [Methanosarcinales archaeon]